MMDWVWIATGLVLLTVGAKYLVESAARLALRLGLSAGLVGATIVAFGTSAPEMVLSATAALTGDPEKIKIAVGNIIGSNICNILLILGVSGVFSGMKAEKAVLRWDGPWLLISAAALALVIWIGADGESSPAADVASHGITGMEGLVLLILLGGFVGTAIVRAARDRGAEVPPEVTEQILNARSKHWGLDVLILLAGFAALAVGSDRLVEGATGIATALDIDSAIIGLTVVAIGTSLPELATSVAAARKGQADLAIANVTGSNIQNILVALGVSAALYGFTRSESIPVQELFATWDLWIMLAATLLLLGFLAYDGRITRFRAWLLLLGYVGFVCYLFETAGSRV